VVDNPPMILAHIKAGTINALAVAGKQRLAVLPNVPTAAEAVCRRRRHPLGSDL